MTVHFRDLGSLREAEDRHSLSVQIPGDLVSLGLDALSGRPGDHADRNPVL